MVIFKGPPSFKGKLPRSPSRMWILRMTILCAESMAFGKPFIVGHEKVILDLWLLPFGLENGGKPLVPLKTMTIGATCFKCFNPRCRYYLEESLETWDAWGRWLDLQSILCALGNQIVGFPNMKVPSGSFPVILDSIDATKTSSPAALLFFS